MQVKQTNAKTDDCPESTVSLLSVAACPGKSRERLGSSLANSRGFRRAPTMSEDNCIRPIARGNGAFGIGISSRVFFRLHILPIRHRPLS
jgi:hypothetical protein